jgi:hypothetical protein
VSKTTHALMYTIMHGTESYEPHVREMAEEKGVGVVRKHSANAGCLQGVIGRHTVAGIWPPFSSLRLLQLSIHKWGFSKMFRPFS